MREVGLVGESGDNLVAAVGEGDGNAGFSVGKGREDQQSAVGKWLTPFGRDALGQSPRGADDDGLLAAKQDSQAFPLNGRVKTADDAAARVSPDRRLIVSGENGTAGTAGGAEERGLGQGEEIEVAEGRQRGWGGAS